MAADSSGHRGPARLASLCGSPYRVAGSGLSEPLSLETGFGRLAPTCNPRRTVAARLRVLSAVCTHSRRASSPLVSDGSPTRTPAGQRIRGPVRERPAAHRAMRQHPAPLRSLLGIPAPLAASGRAIPPPGFARYFVRAPFRRARSHPDLNWIFATKDFVIHQAVVILTAWPISGPRLSLGPHQPASGGVTASAAASGAACPPLAFVSPSREQHHGPK